MISKTSRYKRNLFEVDNARNLSIQELVDTFIPTQSFWRLLSAKHHIVLGARGQGKTALAKMLSHEHLALLGEKKTEPRALSAIHDQEFIGIYLPTRLEWVGGLKNKPWLDEGERENFFQWRLNIASCIAFIPIAKSCISTYVEGAVKQAKAERALVSQLSKDWLADENFEELMQLRRYLEDTDYRKQIQILRERVLGYFPNDEMPEGIAFGIDLFSPLRQGMRRLSDLLSINKDCTWLLCLDEAEFLEKADHRIINSFMRAYPDKLFFKVTTMPYCHYTLSTNIGADLVPGHDFDYVNMDSDRVIQARIIGESDTIGTMFGRTLFKKIFEASEKSASSGGKEIPSAYDILGESEILDPQRKDWDPQSDNFKMLETYASEATIKRARRLVGKKNFKSQISRKIHGALLLRKEMEKLKGNKAHTSYSGARMAIRCADGNPRHLIKIFNQLLMQLSHQQKRLVMYRNRRKKPWISPADQTRIMRALSTTTLNRVKSFPKVGPELHFFLSQLGQYMHTKLYKKPLSTDQVSSIQIDSSVSIKDWDLIRVAVGHGLLHPNVGYNNPDDMPLREGTFRLSYSLSPHFYLIPRKGKSVRISTVKKFSEQCQDPNNRCTATAFKQIPIFNDGDSE